ncbi:MAG: SGNH/GDSL hydrolase family protein [Clostridiaceae bacterium]|nr:SGNH/GDSL hydrolase family protein [Clostridiaceae bacterium]
MLLKDNDVVLFQGDSITDCGRKREAYFDLGAGYPAMIASLFAAMHPEMEVTFLNRGISGNRAKDLAERWFEDCIELKPTVVSILIGINDTWRRYDSNDPTSAESYEKSYRRILTLTRENTDARIILLEPFVLQVPGDRKAWREDLDPKIQVVRSLAREFGTLFIPLDGIFAEYSTHKPPEFWAADGVHPTTAGHAVIARAWMQSAGAI